MREEPSHLLLAVYPDTGGWEGVKGRLGSKRFKNDLATHVMSDSFFFKR